MSTSPVIPLFGRTWSLNVLTAPSGSSGQQTLINVSSDDDPQALRITFDISMTANRALWEARIEIWNMDPKLIGYISQGAQVSLSAGYKADGQPTEIFRGTVFQPTFERRNVVDFVVTLYCILGLPEVQNNFVKNAIGPVQTQWQIVQQACKSAGIPIAYMDPESSFTPQTLPRGKTIFGTPNKLFAQIAQQNNMVSFYGPSGLVMGKPRALSGNPDYIYGPKLAEGQQPASNESQITRSLIGSPEQNELGVGFRVLLDPRLQIKLPLTQVQILGAVINQLPLTLGKYSSTLSKDGIYLVAGVRHIGDSRGNEWYSEVIGVTSASGLLALLGSNSNTSVT